MGEVRPGEVLLALVAALLSGCGDDDEETPPAAEAEKTHFGYTADDGPSKWASLDPAYATCGSGKRQSPIDLEEGEPAQLPEIRFAYTPSAIEVENNGPSVQADYPRGSSIELSGARSELQQFHFHAHSESTLDELIDVLPRLPEDGDHVELDGLDPEELMPAGAGSAPRWSFTGSLTTPPCTEGASWQVLGKPVRLSQQQIDRFTSLCDHNNRPVQPLNGRRVLVDGA